MPIFNCFFKIANKNKGMVLTYVGIFTALVLILSESAASDYSTDYNSTALSVAVIDRDDSTLSRELTNYLGERHNLVDLSDDTETLQDALFYREVEYILMIPNGFEAAFTGGTNNVLLENVKLPGSMSGIYLDSQIDRYLVTLNTYLIANFQLSDALTCAARDFELGTTVEIYGQQKEGASSSDYFFQYLAYILIALIISALGPILMAFNQRDLRQRMESSSLKLRERNTQIALGCIVTSVAIWAVFMIVALAIYREEMFAAVSSLQVLNSLVFLIVCISITFMLGQLLKNTTTLAAVNNAIALGMSFLCGIFVPQWLLGKGVLSAAKFLPAYWYIRSNDMLSGVPVISAADMRLYGEGILVQFGFAVAIFTVALVVSRQKKHSQLV